jgi:hypothetical protein
MQKTFSLMSSSPSDASQQSVKVEYEQLADVQNDMVSLRSLVHGACGQVSMDLQACLDA